MYSERDDDGIDARRRTGAGLKQELDPALAARVPPGQILTAKWPVLTYGRTPRFDPARWTFRCYGLVEHETTWTWPEFLALDWAAVAEAMAGTLVIDGRNALDPGAVEAAGLVYEGIGRAPRAAPDEPVRGATSEAAH